MKIRIGNLLTAIGVGLILAGAATLMYTALIYPVGVN